MNGRSGGIASELFRGGFWRLIGWDTSHPRRRGVPRTRFLGQAL